MFAGSNVMVRPVSLPVDGADVVMEARDAGLVLQRRRELEALLIVIERLGVAPPRGVRHAEVAPRAEDGVGVLNELRDAERLLPRDHGQIEIVPRPPALADRRGHDA